ncbi:AAA family ATPase [Brevibacterium sp. 5221]|uniref:AAA family ATPase n=1 Tax=Brevibacterium rongguiense TaxID=2695267 RepID=A0A6N9H8W0_9MICO|nr:ParA family protein [Brevibacterium rongguiense]MYM20478.1 AAA family ATPase [Brevibacterium rongguiense]
MKIAVQNTKGGVGKTRTAMFLAEAARRAGEQAAVWDIDQQGTATSWADRCLESQTPLGFTVEPMNLAGLRRAEPAAGVVVLDTPPGNPQITGAAFQWADITVIPTGPTSDETERAVETWGMGNGAPAGILLTRYVKNERESWDTLLQLRNSDAPDFETVIPRRVAIASAFGQPMPRSLGNYDKLYLELMQVVNSIHESE